MGCFRGQQDEEFLKQNERVNETKSPGYEMVKESLPCSLSCLGWSRACSLNLKAQLMAGAFK